MLHVAIWMDLEIIILSEVNPESKKKKKIQMNFIYKTETDYRLGKQMYLHQRRKVEAGIN